MKKISRRKFIQLSSLASASLLIPAFIKPLQASTFRRHISDNSKKLIIIQLSGGNDGLNTIIPYKNDIYYKYRNSISISENDVLKINDELGFNPVMEKLKGIYDNGNLSVINSVGYPNPNRSHFKSMDIWHSASDSNENINTGWIGRYLDSECMNCKNPYNAIEVNENLSLALKGEIKSGIAVEDPERFFKSTSENFFLDVLNTNKNHSHDENVSYLYKTMADATSSAEYVYKTSKIYKSKSDYPNTNFGKDMKTIAELIISEINSSVFYVSLSGFDTHVNQTGRQERLLKELSECLSALNNDLKINNKQNEVLVMVFSEFGRRVKQNGSNGTDHGTANNIFLMNGNLKNPGFHNEAPDLSDLENGDLKYKIDFRNIYSSILTDWLGVESSAILGKKYNTLNIF
ncbi:MAG TPA: DUF1501 domain-containing protein [Ignavibacteria bacterium]|nr:DUF1501 domain-containing protein [Ignavibacteria bacterium]